MASFTTAQTDTVLVAAPGGEIIDWHKSVQLSENGALTITTSTVGNLFVGVMCRAIDV